MFDTTYDVVVVGGGNAALCAALSARGRGATVLLLEHAPVQMRGGNSRHTRNLRCMHGAANDFLTGPYLEEEFWEDLLKVTGGLTDEAMARFTIRTSDSITDWMMAHGARFQPALSGTLQLSRTNAFFRGGGKALMNAYYATAERVGVKIAYGCEVTDLEIEHGRFHALTCDTPDGPARVTARSAVVASGGFEANTEWLKEAWGPVAENFIIRGTPFNRGTVLRRLIELGARSVSDPTQGHAVAIDARSPKFDGGIVTRLDCVPFGIVVNQRAERFYDEGEDFWPKRYAIWGRLVAGQPDQIAYSIIDSKSVNEFMPSVFPAVKADTLDGLAGELGLDVGRLEASVSEFNDAVVAGGHFDPKALDDCRTDGIEPPKTHWARAIDKPPYYAYPLRPGITFTYYGVKVDRQARIQMQDGSAVENLYAAGEIMAGNILGKGYLAGFGMTIGTVFGRIAGTEAASHAAE